VESRTEVVDGWKPVGWDAVEKIQAYYEPWIFPHLEVDGVNSIDTNFEKILQYLQVA
jgi:hypothetical protein